MKNKQTNKKTVVTCDPLLLMSVLSGSPVPIRLVTCSHQHDAAEVMGCRLCDYICWLLCCGGCPCWLADVGMLRKCTWEGAEGAPQLASAKEASPAVLRH